ncbi:hypothetical protein F5Y15DRAFT_270246 [Xylariaceae sp. FL0016]|nr:hypothetical protein F5Y15DRAFT_270246 [Xylariaceae sp. FL0016]
MDLFVGAFMRVLRSIDDAAGTLQAIADLEQQQLAEPSNPGPSPDLRTRLRILDFPDPDVAAANIARASSRPGGKDELLRLAAEEPAQLTSAEIGLLRERYWLDVSNEEVWARVKGPEEDHGSVVADRLKAVQSPLYEAPHEERAIENALKEWGRRWMAEHEERRVRETEAVLGRAAPWVRRLWEEDRGEKSWGFARFVRPGAAGDEARWEEWDHRTSAALFDATDKIACGSWISIKYYLQRLDWPESGMVGDAGPDEGKGEDETVAQFPRLREHFRSIRDRESQMQGTAAGTDILKDGMLRNTFLVVDRACVNSVVTGAGNYDGMWVWAVDPDYRPEHPPDDDGYRGYLRVRVQQLVNNFYEARRFRADELPMPVLWEAARKSQKHAFASVKDEEAQLYSISRIDGSIVRYTPARIVSGPPKTVSFLNRGR